MNAAQFRENFRQRIRDKITERLGKLQGQLEEECENCNLSVGTGMALSICKSLNYQDCDELYNKVINEEIEMDTVVDMLVDRTEGKEEQKILKELKRMMHTPLKELERQNRREKDK